jgi:hypothetical protein
MRFARACILITAVLAPACQFGVSLDGLDDGLCRNGCGDADDAAHANGAANGAMTANDEVADASAIDPGSDASPSRVLESGADTASSSVREAGADTSFEDVRPQASDASSPCPSGRGPTMVRAGPGGFCIDSTEVTNGQYAAFLANAPAGFGANDVCAFKTTHVPTDNWPQFVQEYPVRNVDWCDAKAFCEWAGKRLCGQSPVNGKMVTEWHYACVGTATAHPIPTGANICNYGDAPGATVAVVGSFTRCEGGFSGIFDMLGSVAEWVDGCTGTKGATDTCYIAGGSFESDGADCELTYPWARGETDVDYGIRCCAP